MEPGRTSWFVIANSDTQYYIYTWDNYLGLPHMATHDDEYNGYFIPAGTTIVGNTWWDLFHLTSSVTFMMDICHTQGDSS